MARKLTGIRPRHARSCAAPRGGKMLVSADVGGVGLLAARGEEDPQDVPHARRREGMAGGRSRGAPQAHAADALAGNASTGAGVVARRREGGRDHKAERTGVQTLRAPTYEQTMRDRVLPDLGGGRLSEIRRVDLQDFAGRLRGPRECASPLWPWRSGPSLPSAFDPSRVVAVGVPLADLSVSSVKQRL